MVQFSDQYEYQKRLAAWNRARAVSNNDPSVFRKDIFGNWIRWDDYGDRQAKYGWEVDHIVPLSKGGSDSLDNVQALHWQANLAKSDHF
jgi:hypothetical protein